MKINAIRAESVGPWLGTLWPELVRPWLGVLRRELAKPWIGAIVVWMIGLIVDAQLAALGSVNERYSGFGDLVVWRFLPWLVTLAAVAYAGTRLYEGGDDPRRAYAAALAVPAVALLVTLLRGPIGGDPWAPTLSLLVAGAVGALLGWQAAERIPRRPPAVRDR